jgi:hypothetical protein
VLVRSKVLDLLILPINIWLEGLRKKRKKAYDLGTEERMRKTNGKPCVTHLACYVSTKRKRRSARLLRHQCILHAVAGVLDGRPVGHIRSFYCLSCIGWLPPTVVTTNVTAKFPAGGTDGRTVVTSHYAFILYTAEKLRSYLTPHAEAKIKMNVLER